MKLTTKGRYAVTAMLDLALNGDGKPISLTNLSKRTGISLSYLEQLFAKLRRNQLVKSIRGPSGGYKLNHSAGEITIASIIDAVNESIDVTVCGGKADCQNGRECITHELWLDLSQEISRFLSGITLQSIIDREQAKKEQRSQGVEQETPNQMPSDQVNVLLLKE